MAQLVFARKEMKFEVPAPQYSAFLAAVQERLRPDAYGLYTVCNLYYDTDIFNLIRMSMDRPVYKEKLRVRSYGVPTPESQVFVEIKKKYEGIVYKRRESLSYREACAFLEEGAYPAAHDSQIMRELQYFLQMHRPSPKLFLAYDRMAFAGQGEESDLRLTLDQNIRYRIHDVALSQGMEGEPLYEKDFHLMEIKTAGAMPLWLAALLSQYGIRRISFSKYARIYEKECRAGRLCPCPVS